ncbi:MAG: hypothetical protein Q9212_001968 [Teloschistes hypoglaucus]
MSETCIVCLGDLGVNGNDLDPPLSSPVTLEQASNHQSKSPDHVADIDDERIAHLLPCGHDLHNGCLKPWVERANSCPICRQNFHHVELTTHVGAVGTGPVITSYAVEDRIQVADIDPSMYVDDLDDDPEFPPCPICGDEDNEELLLSCDGCDIEYHTYCVDLDEVPRGHWFCGTCDAQRAIENVNTTRTPRRSHRTADRRTRAQQRRERSRLQRSHSGWARVWQSVWDRLNLDLDFPFDDEPGNSQGQRGARGVSEHRDVRQWERRLQIAERQGGANRFRETANALLDVNEIRQLRTTREKKPPSPEPESQEELRAWNAMEKAKEIQLGSSSTRRKRKSPTASPSDAGPATEPERPLKRPRTRRNPDIQEPVSDSLAESSSAARRFNIDSTPRTEGPSFLQSLLKEVESSTGLDESKASTRPSAVSTAGHPSPGYTSPGPSPPASNHASPRALSATPPPSLSPRSASPVPLTSKIEPVFALPTLFSPSRSPQDNHRTGREWKLHSNGDLHHPRPRHRNHFSSSPTRDDENSPPRVNMSLTAKEGVQRMVSTALRPYWHRSEVSKDQFTDINRNVSRMLYEKVGGDENLNDEAKDVWEKMANEEVEKAVQTLKAPS